MLSALSSPSATRRQRFVGKGTVLAIAAVTAAAIFGTLQSFPRERATPVLLGGIVFGVLASVGMGWAERREGNAAVSLMLALMSITGAYVVWVSDGSGFIITMPLISMAVLYRSVRMAIALTVLLGLWLSFVVHRLDPSLGAIFQGWTQLASAATFVIVFSRIALRERLARADLQVLTTEVELKNRRLSEYAAQIEDLATAKERNRIAREIHDSLAHYLTVVHVQIEAAKTLARNNPDGALSHLARAQRLTQDGLREVRRSVAVLRAAPTEGRPFAIALAELVAECTASGVATELRVDGAPRPLAAAVEFTLYRAVQEALTNVRRHAHASRATLILTYDDENVRLRVEDDGVGAGGGEVKEGFGLLGLRERVALVAGSVSIAKPEGRGFSLDVQVPA